MKNLISFTFFLLLFSSSVLAGNGGIEEKGNPEKGDSINEDGSSVVETTFFDTAAIYTEDWNNNVTFWYPQFNYSDSSLLKLTDSTFSYAFPVEKKTTSGFGRRHSSQHKGIDIPLKTGDAVVSAFDGKVRYAKYNSGGFGYLVIVRHVNGLETYYAHLSKIKVKPNQVIKAGELLGLGGSTGRSYSPHLHFEVRYNHHAFNPEKIFDLENFCLRTEEAMVCELVSKKSYKGHSHGKSQVSTANLKEGTVYAIRSGDTLGKIAGKYGTSVSALCRLNGMTKTAVLQIGQKIRVK
jgi:murein DD-endopeptidase MepM/ murein hydrolase activator NlpD